MYNMNIPQGHWAYLDEHGNIVTMEISPLVKFNHIDYMIGKCTHNEYYEQFVTLSLIDNVCRLIGKDKIKASKDKYFNDIPLQKWDGIAHIAPIQLLALSQGTTCALAKGKPLRVISLSDKICLLKAAARIVRGY